MRIIMMRSNPVDPDPRVEKEINTMLKFGFELKVLAWERNALKGIEKRKTLSVENGKVPIDLFYRKASFGRGIINGWSLFLFQVFLLKKLVQYRKDYDVIHACDFDTVIPAFVIAKLFGKKYVYDIFDYYVDAFRVPTILMRLIESIDIHMINKSDAVIIVNESRIEQIKKSAPKYLSIIHNSPDSVISKSQNFTPLGMDIPLRKKLRFVYVGVLSKSRFLIEIAEIIADFKDAELHIAGFGDLEGYFMKMSSEKENIFFYGKINYCTTLALTAYGDLVLAIYNPVVPNHRYSSPNKLYEAMLVKKPIIVAEGTGIDEVIQVNNTGFVVAYDKKSLTTLLEELIQTDPNVFHAMGAKANNLYVEKYSWSIMEERIKSLYMQL